MPYIIGAQYGAPQAFKEATKALHLPCQIFAMSEKWLISRI